MDAFTHSDYRELIREYYQAKKAATPGFSYRYLAEKAGINSSAFFKFVIEGKRNLSLAHIPKVAEALDLKGQEAEYFMALVRFNQAKKVADKDAGFKRLTEIRGCAPISRIESDRFDYFSAWYHPVIRELAASRSFGEDFGRLGRLVCPPISAKDARASIALLLKLGFLTRESGGSKANYFLAEPKVATAYGVKSHLVIGYQIRMLKLAIESFDRFSIRDRITTSSSTVRLSARKFDAYVKYLHAFQRKLLDEEGPDGDPDEVYQLNINLFPVSRSVKRERKDVRPK